MGVLPIGTMTVRLAARLKAWRARRGLTQKQLAARAKLSHGYLARLEIGRHDPTLGILKKLARALRVKIGQLVE